MSRYEGKVKSSSLAYNRLETRDKRSLGKDSDYSWCYLHASVKLFWLQPMAPWTWIYGLRPKELYHTCSSCPGSYPTARVSRRIGRELFILPPIVSRYKQYENHLCKVRITFVFINISRKKLNVNQELNRTKSYAIRIWISSRSDMDRHINLLRVIT